MANLKGTVQNFRGFQFNCYQTEPDLIAHQPYFIDTRIEISDEMRYSWSYHHDKVLDLYSRDEEGDALHFVKFRTTDNWLTTNVFPIPGANDVHTVGIRVFLNADFVATGGKLFAQRVASETEYGPLMGTTVGSLYYVDFSSGRDRNGPDTSSLTNGMWLFGSSGPDSFFTLFLASGKSISLTVSEEVPDSIFGYKSIVPRLSVASAINSAFSQDITKPTVESLAVDITAEVDKNISSFYTAR